MGQGNKTAWTLNTKKLQSMLCSGCTGTLQTLPVAFLLSFQLFSPVAAQELGEEFLRHKDSGPTSFFPWGMNLNQLWCFTNVVNWSIHVNPGISGSPYPYRNYLDDITRSGKSRCFVLGGFKRTRHVAKMEPDRLTHLNFQETKMKIVLYKDWRMTNMHSTAMNIPNQEAWMHPSSENGVIPLKDSMVEGFPQHSMNRMVLPFIWKLDSHDPMHENTLCQWTGVKSMTKKGLFPTQNLDIDRASRQRRVLCFGGRAGKGKKPRSKRPQWWKHLGSKFPGWSVLDLHTHTVFCMAHFENNMSNASNQTLCLWAQQPPASEPGDHLPQMFFWHLWAPWATNSQLQELLSSLEPAKKTAGLTGLQVQTGQKWTVLRRS